MVAAIIVIVARAVMTAEAAGEIQGTADMITVEFIVRQVRVVMIISDIIAQPVKVVTIHKGTTVTGLKAGQ